MFLCPPFHPGSRDICHHPWLTLHRGASQGLLHNGQTLYQLIYTSVHLLTLFPPFPSFLYCPPLSLPFPPYSSFSHFTSYSCSSLPFPSNLLFFSYVPLWEHYAYAVLCFKICLCVLLFKHAHYDIMLIWFFFYKQSLINLKLTWIFIIHIYCNYWCLELFLSSQWRFQLMILITSY